MVRAPRVAACHRTVPGWGAPARPARATDDIDPGFVDELLHEVASLGQPLWLVLDDVEVVRDPKVLGSLELLLRWSPANLHLVLSGRAEPPIGLPRLRVHGAVKEIGTQDLAFTLEETIQLLHRHDVGLSDAELQVLHHRTDGWAAGRQIACMAVASGEEPETFLVRFDGDDHQVADYILREVMDGLPDTMRRFMLRTLLLAELRRDDPRIERELQHTAARWYQQQGDHLHAMEHLAAAGDGEQVIDVARSQGLTAVLSGRARRLHAILAGLPELDRRDPLVALLLTAAALEMGDTPEADRWLAHLDLDILARSSDPALAMLAAAVRTARARFDLDVHAALERLESTAVGMTNDADLDLYALQQRGVARADVGRYPAAASDLQQATVLARAGGRDAMLIAA